MDDELFSFQNVLDRLKKATKTETDIALAKRLGLGQGSISSAKKKGQVPPSWLIRAANDFSVSLDWLYYGEGPMQRGASLSPPISSTESLETELSKEREMNRELVTENRQLWKENGDLRVELEKLRARAAPDEQSSDDIRQSA